MYNGILNDSIIICGKWKMCVLVKSQSFFFRFFELKFVWFLYIDTNENKMYNLPTAKFVIIGFGTFINKLTFSTDIIYHTAHIKYTHTRITNLVQDDGKVIFEVNNQMLLRCVSVP